MEPGWRHAWYMYMVVLPRKGKFALTRDIDGAGLAPWMVHSSTCEDVRIRLDSSLTARLEGDRARQRRRKFYQQLLTKQIIRIEIIEAALHHGCLRRRCRQSLAAERLPDHVEVMLASGDCLLREEVISCLTVARPTKMSF